MAPIGRGFALFWRSKKGGDTNGKTSNTIASSWAARAAEEKTAKDWRKPGVGCSWVVAGAVHFAGRRLGRYRWRSIFPYILIRRRALFGGSHSMVWSMAGRAKDVDTLCVARVPHCIHRNAGRSNWGRVGTKDVGSVCPARSGLVARIRAAIGWRLYVCSQENDMHEWMVLSAGLLFVLAAAVDTHMRRRRRRSNEFSHDAGGAMSVAMSENKDRRKKGLALYREALKAWKQ